MPLMAGTRVGSYEVISQLGAGGMGEVYRAHDPRLSRDVAVKVMPAQLAADSEWLARFRREARALAALQHPNIVTIHAVEDTPQGSLLAMELVEGAPLSREIAAGAASPARVLELAIPMADALGAAHARGIVHRDLKPDNIVVGVDGRLRLLDFGLARKPATPLDGSASDVTTAVTRLGTIVGTVTYMSPEQAQGLPVDARSDVFSLGIILYELATGRRPFEGGDPMSVLGAILHAAPASCEALNPAVPLRLGGIVRRCLEKDPALRFENGAALHRELVRLRDWATVDGPAELVRVVDRIQGLEEGPEAWEAFQLGREIAKLTPNDPQLLRLQPFFTRPLSFTSDPAGASVLVRYYGDPDAPWTPMGVTPLEDVPWPKGFTRLRLEREGVRPVEDLIWNFEWIGPSLHYPMAPPGHWPDEMEWVPAGKFPLFMPGLDHLDAESVAGFLFDRDPVTNRAFQRFVDAGGYRKKELWPERIRVNGEERTRDDLLAELGDATGQPGPATWEAGTCPPGQEDFPVTGVSWYEALAYASWAGKALPTIFHWSRVAFTCASARIVAFANLAGKGLLPVGSTHSVNRFGVRDLAGNVREWAWNAANEDKRFLLGGGWNDPEYAFTDAWAQAPLDRSATNGFRCMLPVEPETHESRLTRGIEIPVRDFRAETPVPDAVFEFFVRQFRYDPLPLAATIEADETTLVGRMQTVTLAAAYGGERLTVYILLPERPGPSQVVVVFPGSNSIHTRVFNPLDLRRSDFLVRSGRVVVLPVYKGTYHRGGDLRSDYPAETAAYRDYVIAWARDLGRAIDYVESRSDMDASRIGYYGLSWGGYLGAILPAIERRIRANVLYVAGLTFQRALPEVDAIHYIGRVTQPTLMLNGELDFFFPVETSQKPMFELLGTPPEHKKRMTFTGGHSVPRVEMIRETLAWWNRYLGPVE